MYKIPITGAPHSGKTTLLEALKGEYSDAHFIAEPATLVINRELAKHEQDSNYVPRVPWLNYSLFAQLVQDEAIRQEKNIPSDATLVFQDRSLYDVLAYHSLNNISRHIKEVQQLAAAADYAFAFFCAAVGEYALSSVRREQEDHATQINTALLETYNSSGLAIIRLPAISVEERLSIVRQKVTDLTNNN